MEFRTMKNSYYYGGTIFIYIVTILMGLTISNMGLIFEIVAALTKTSINFIWPGLFYLLAEERFVTEKDKSKKDRVISRILITLGISVFIMVFSATIYDMI
jgi:amino acid permease